MDGVDDTVEYVGRSNAGCRKGYGEKSIATSNMRPSSRCDIPKKPTTIDSNMHLMHRCRDCKVPFYAVNKPTVIKELEEPAILPEQQEIQRAN